MLDSSHGEQLTQERVLEELDVEREFATRFHFVSSNDPLNSRKSVRKHVMREYRRRERWEKGEGRGERISSTCISHSKRSQVSSPSSAWEADPFEGWDALDGNSAHWLATPESLSLAETPGHLLVVGKRRKLDLSLGKSVTRTDPSTLRHSHPWTDLGCEKAKAYDGAVPFRFNPWAAVAAADVDPFSKINFGTEPAMQALFHQCKFIELYPVNARQRSEKPQMYGTGQGHLIYGLQAPISVEYLGFIAKSQRTTQNLSMFVSVSLCDTWLASVAWKNQLWLLSIEPRHYKRSTDGWKIL